MARTSIIFEILIASPSDVKDERETLKKVIYAWNNSYSKKFEIFLVPIMWETHTYSEFGDEPQSIVNKQIDIDNIDMVIGIFGNRIGTNTKNYVSGTIEELQNFIKKEKPTMVFFSTNDLVISDNLSKEQGLKAIEQKGMVKEFQKECRNKSIYFEFKSLNDFETLLKKQIDLKFSKIQFEDINLSILKKVKTLKSSSLSNSEILSSLDGYLTKLADIIEQSNNEVLFTSTKMSSTDDEIYGSLQKRIIEVSKKFKTKNPHRNHYGIIDSSPETKKGAIELRHKVNDIVLKFNQELDWLGFNFLISDERYVILRLKQSNGNDKYSIFIDNKDLAKIFKQIFLELWHNSTSMNSHIGNIYNQDTNKIAESLQISHEDLRLLLNEIFKIDDTYYALPYNITQNTIEKYFHNSDISEFSVDNGFNTVFEYYRSYNYTINKKSIYLLRRFIIENQALDYDKYSDSFFFMYFLANYLKTRHSLENIKTYIQNTKNYKILDIGGGGGASASAILNFLADAKIDYKQLDIIDYSDKQLTITKQLVEKKHDNINFYLDDINNKINDLEQYDLIIASNVFCEISRKDIKKLISKIKAKLTKDGLLLVIERTESGVYDNLIETELNQLSYVYKNYRFKLNDETNAKIEEFLNKESLKQYKDYVKRGYTLRYGLYQ